MRQPAATTLMLTACATLLAGCGNSTEDPSPKANPSPATSSPATATATAPVQEWNALAKNYNGFINKTFSIGGVKNVPIDATDFNNQVKYTFTDNVTFTFWETNLKNGTTKMCLTGPNNTYFTHSDIGQGIQRRTFGTGKCSYDDGDIVLSIIDPSTPDKTDPKKAVETATKGADLAKKVPAIEDNPLRALR